MRGRHGGMVVVNGVRYRRADAVARGLLDEQSDVPEPEKKRRPAAPNKARTAAGTAAPPATK